jgi:hypothetical protein
MIFGRVERYTNAVRIHLSSGPVSIAIVVIRRNVHCLPDRVLIDEARIVLGRESPDIFGDVVSVNGNYPFHWADSADIGSTSTIEKPEMASLWDRTQ